jgi:hypothetical protein
VQWSPVTAMQYLQQKHENEKIWRKLAAQITEYPFPVLLQKVPENNETNPNTQ